MQEGFIMIEIEEKWADYLNQCEKNRDYILECLKRKFNIEFAIKMGAFDIVGAKSELHFDERGILRLVDSHKISKRNET